MAKTRSVESRRWIDPRPRVPKAGSMDYCTTRPRLGQSTSRLRDIDQKNQVRDRIYITTGEAGNGFTYQTMVVRLVAIEIGSTSKPVGPTLSPKACHIDTKARPMYGQSTTCGSTCSISLCDADINGMEDLVL